MSRDFQNFYENQSMASERHKSLISQSHPHAITTFFSAIITKVWSAKSGVIRLMEKFSLAIVEC